VIITANNHRLICKKGCNIGVDGHISGRMTQRKAISNDLTSVVYNIVNVQLCVEKIIALIHVEDKRYGEKPNACGDTRILPLFGNFRRSVYTRALKFTFISRRDDVEKRERKKKEITHSKLVLSYALSFSSSDQ